MFDLSSCYNTLKKNRKVFIFSGDIDHGDIRLKTTRQRILIRLKEEDMNLLKKLAEKYDISASDVVRIALKRLAEELDAKTLAETTERTVEPEPDEDWYRER